jgi:long-chain fatty acid transport protein
MRTKECRHIKHYKKQALVVLLASISQPTWATGFQMIQQNVTNMGTGYAGTASLAEDASTNFYNTAGLTRLGHEQIVAGGVLALGNTTLQVNRATATTGPVLTNPSTGQARPSNGGMLPFLHYSKRIDDRWIFGLSLTVPFGSKTNYQNNTLARYVATRSEMKTMDLSPGLAYQFDNGVSLGTGVDALYMVTKADFRIAPFGGSNINTDGLIENTSSNSAMGYHIGGLYEINSCTRFGVQYHSKFTVKTKGQSLTQLAPGLATTSQGIRTDFNLPDSAVLSAYHAFNDQWAAMADIQWTGWNRFKNITTRYDNGSQLIMNENYTNTYRVAAGGSYQYNDPWLIRFGLMFDKSPVPDVNRNIFIPNQNQIVPALGAQYRICKTLAIDFGYAHVFFKKDNNLNQTAPIAIGRRQGAESVQGSIKNRINTLGLQLTWDIAP